MRIFVALLVLLSACQLTQPRVPERTGIQVENWRGAHATVRAQVHGDSGGVIVAKGTVNETGMLTFGLEPVPAAQLGGFTACSGVTVSDSALKLNAFSAFDVTQGETPKGQLAQASGLEVMTNGLQRGGDYYVQYTYADRKAQIEGRCQEGAPATFSYALTLQRGWNPVMFKLIDEGVLELSTAPVPTAAAWFFRELRP